MPVTLVFHNCWIVIKYPDNGTNPSYEKSLNQTIFILPFPEAAMNIGQRGILIRTKIGELDGLLNFLIYFIIFSYISTGIINFFVPIHHPTNVIIIFLCTMLSLFTCHFTPIEIFRSNHFVLPFSKVSFFLICPLAVLWFVIILIRPTIADDAVGYHLPISLLMNNSLWYPGIGKLSSHYGFPNGISVLGSLFTAFNKLSLENIPNFTIWIIFGWGILLYLLKENISVHPSLMVSGVFLLSPDIFWQSYNMGTDLPSACFLAFGLLALAERRFNDSCLFFALSFIFKPLGLVAFILTIPCVLYCFVKSKKIFDTHHIKIFLSFILISVTIVRTYIATGNPIYPLWPLNLTSWGIDLSIQNQLINGHDLRYYSGVERTLKGVAEFLVYLFVRPHLIKSSYWFAPFFTSCLLIAIFLFLRNRYYKSIDLFSVYIFFIINVLIVIWFLYSPLFRFIMGVFIFINITLFVFIYKHLYYSRQIILVYATLYLTCFLFSLNVIKHLDNNVISVLLKSPQSLERWMPWEYGKDRSKLILEKLEDGFMFSKSKTQYCYKMRQPCISERSLDSKENLISQYRKYNNL